MIDKLIHNQAAGDTKCQQVLGSEARVKVISSFWEKNAELVHLIAADGLLEYCQSEEFTSGEVQAFRKGIKIFGEFCMRAWAESNPEPKN